MSHSTKKQIALIAHDACKQGMVEWVKFNIGTLETYCEIWATQTTGQSIQKEMQLPIHLLLSGPKGGDSQIGAMISETRLNMLIFFWDPLSVQPHDVDIKALLRLAVLHDVPVACNRSSADHMISSPLFRESSQNNKE